MDADLLAELPEAQQLALAHSPAGARAKALAVLALDARLAGIVRKRGEPMLAQMRLAWWRDMLRSPASSWPRGEPVLAALATWQDPARLAALTDGWEFLLTDRLDKASIEGFASGRQAAFAALAAELGAAEGPIGSAARTWALADLAANLSDPSERALVLETAGSSSPERLPRSLRALAILSALGARALARGGRPLLEGRGAALVALRVGLFGR